MKGFAALLSGCALAAVCLASPVHARDMPAFSNSGTTPGDAALMFRKYRGDDEVEDRDHSGRGSGGGGGGHDGGGRGGSDQPAKNSSGGKDQGSSGGGKKGGGGNSRDGGDRFGN